MNLGHLLSRPEITGVILAALDHDADGCPLLDVTPKVQTRWVKGIARALRARRAAGVL
jgi:hypothetical protein